MPNRKKRARRRQGGAGALLPAIIAALAVVAVALAVVLVQSDPLAQEPMDERLPYQYTSPIEFTDDATPEPLVLGVAVAAPTPSPTKQPPLWGDPSELETEAPQSTEEAGGEAAPEATENPASYALRLAPTPMPGDYFLPVYDRALRTPNDRAMIAVTIDECDKPERMVQIVEIAERYGAKLTLFPTGAALMGNPELFHKLYYDFGCELENYTYDAGKLDYALSDGEFALQIWRQGIATSYVLGADYHQHFYRPATRQSAVDQRTHFFLRKLNIYGIASYTSGYFLHDVDYLSKSLANGNIYQFDMTDESMEVFEGFLAEANRKGYKMVTMNELCGLDANELGVQLTIGEQNLPGLEDYVPTYYDLKLNNRARAVYRLQSRLLELGYLVQVPGDHMSDGIYGADTSIAVSEFQAQVGLAATGDADVETQERLFAADAPVKAGYVTPEPEAP